MSFVPGKYRMYDPTRVKSVCRQLSRLALAFVVVVCCVPRSTAQDAEEDFALAANQYSLGNWDRAADGFRRIIAAHDNHPRAVLSRFFLGESLVQLGDYDLARDAFIDFESIATDPSYLAQSTYRIGETSFLLDDFESAETWLERFHARYADHELGAYSHPYLGDVYFARERFDDAAASYRFALTHYVDTPLADHCRLGIARIAESSNRIDEARRFLTLVAQGDTELVDEAIHELLRIARDEENIDRVEQLWSEHADTLQGSDFEAACRFMYAEALVAQGDYRAADEALEPLERTQVLGAMRLKQEHAAAVSFQVASLAWEQEDEAFAYERFQQLLAWWPESEWAEYSLEMMVRIASARDDHEQVDWLADQFVSEYSDSHLTVYVLELQGRGHYDRAQYQDAAASFASATSRSEFTDFDATFRANLRYLYGLSLIAIDETLAATEQLLLAETTLLETQQPLEQSAITDRLLTGIQMALASSFSSLEEYERAIQYREAVLAGDVELDEQADCMVELVVNHLLLDQVELAAEWAEKLSIEHRSHPRWQTVIREVGEAAFAMEDWEIAQRHFLWLSDSSQPDSTRAEGYSGLGWIAFRQEDWDAAREAFVQSTEIVNLGEKAAEAFYMLGRIDEMRNDVSSSISWYDQIESADAESEHHLDAQIRTARLLRLVGTDAANQRSESLYIELLRSQQENGIRDGLMYEYAWLLAEIDRIDESRTLFQELIAEYPESEYWTDSAFRVAESRSVAREFAESNELLHTILTRSDVGQLEPYIHYLLGQNAIHQHQWDEAARSMTNVVDTATDENMIAAASYWHGESLFRLDRHAEATEVFAALLEEPSSTTEPWRPTIQLRIAQLAALDGRWGEAIQTASALHESRADLARPYELDYLLGRCYSSLGRFTDARDAYERVVSSPLGSKTETAAQAQWMIGESYFHQERFTEAIDAFEKVEVLYGYPRWQAAALLQAGKCHERSGNREGAVKLYARLIRDHSDSEFATEAATLLEAARAPSGSQR